MYSLLHALHKSGLYINIIYSYVVRAVDKNISIYTLYFSRNPPRSRCNNVNKAKSPENKTFYTSIRAYIIVLYYFCSYACIFVRCIPFSFSVWFIVSRRNRIVFWERIPILYIIIRVAFRYHSDNVNNNNNMYSLPLY